MLPWTSCGNGGAVVTPPEILALRSAADEAEAVHAEKADAFEVERSAAVKLLALAVSAVLPAFNALAVRQQFFGPEELSVVPVGSKTKGEESRKLYLTPSCGFLEATYAYRAGAWAIVGLADVTNESRQVQECRVSRHSGRQVSEESCEQSL